MYRKMLMGKKICITDKDYVALVKRFNPESFKRKKVPVAVSSDETAYNYVPYVSKVSCPMCSTYDGCENCLFAQFEVCSPHLDRFLPGCLIVIKKILQRKHRAHLLTALRISMCDVHFRLKDKKEALLVLKTIHEYLLTFRRTAK